jgi:hypothetical protein
VGRAHALADPPERRRDGGAPAGERKGEDRRFRAEPRPDCPAPEVKIDPDAALAAGKPEALEEES